MALYTPVPNRDRPVIEALRSLREVFKFDGFPMLFTELRKRGHPWNHKRVHRIYCQLKWNKISKKKRRLPNRNPKPLDVPMTLNESWSMDFMSDSLWSGRSYRTFNVIDDCNREILGTEIDTSLPASRVVRTLDQIAEFRGYPKQIRCDNGPEFISGLLREWATSNQVHLEFIEPGKPTQNSYIERFNRTYREGVLDAFVFNALSEVRDETDIWNTFYNEQRPHMALNKMTPSEKRQELTGESL